MEVSAGWLDACSWRIFRDDDGRHWMYFDPRVEAPGHRGLEEAEKECYLDSVVSVSAVERERDQLELIDDLEQPSEEGFPLVRTTSWRY